MASDMEAHRTEYISLKVVATTTTISTTVLHDVEAVLS